jgi:hypothetical protein
MKASIGTCPQPLQTTPVAFLGVSHTPQFCDKPSMDGMTMRAELWVEHEWINLF